MFSNVVFTTVISGVLVFLFGQVIQLFVLEKIYKFKEIIGKIDNKLKFYLKIIKNPGNEAHPLDRLQVCSQELLQLSSDLESYRKQLIFRRKEKDKEIAEAANLLIDLHFNVFSKAISASDNNLAKVKKIRELLNIPDLLENEKDIKTNVE